jgi:hypothetical protein
MNTLDLIPDPDDEFVYQNFIRIQEFVKNLVIDNGLV